MKKWQSSGELNWVQGFEEPLPKVGTGIHEGPLPVSSGYLFLGVNSVRDGRVWKVPPPQGATKWYPYSPNRRVGNDTCSPMCPSHCPGVRLMHTSKVREIIVDLLSYVSVECEKVQVSCIGPKAFISGLHKVALIEPIIIWAFCYICNYNIFIPIDLVFLFFLSWIIFFNVH